ncbi:Microsomal dipeptidase precursor, putative [Coccidioides posadasii C735 delta SOWgp]|uniref:Putative dipeptidase CPC735_015490 n=1 Tax=Coccidioides posadasii (strain C735) TaxID=222929 RepID=DPEP1_COCP7|nr:Microsomal dipeptidase precursor, putative [Coccidioides posadasii C735 delta SOWgp]C5PCZ0.1 RecName: Full=Putative dipeptidase CPC735_015490; Flags: Precursor [Coccidioides posadasii C735 delta SOWgp]EER24951.1 Microsomal dipeptidase precursor, putative [Coccidioides posadasii C735 delta SOWgp]|eukprot:XP_003067096.1 Microsomal dipeptidase precursor, putative [Coccidioides posadasii C735 delta SOWgp]
MSQRTEHNGSWLRNAGSLLSVLACVAVLASPASATPASAAAAAAPRTDDYLKRAERILKFTPLIDGHNDLPNFIRKTTKNQIYEGKIPFEDELPGHTDLKRLRKGRVGGQFWSVYTPCPDPPVPIDNPTWSVRDTLEQIDVTKRLIEKYSRDLQFCGDARCARRAFRRGKIASFLGIEGGHQIGNSLGDLRRVYELGVRYITVTHNCDNAFATAQSTVADGLPDTGLMKPFGIEFVKEMNRLGMLVDLSHVSANTMRDTLKVARAPVIFSHSSAYAVSNHLRNVPDDVLKEVAKNNGVVMVTFVSRFVNVENPDAADINTVVDHIFHIAKVAGWDHVGIGGDYDGTVYLPKGLEDVSKYPHLIARVLERGATTQQVRKLVGENILRVWTEVERIAKRLQKTELPNEAYWEGRNWTRPAKRDLNADFEGRSVPLFTSASNGDFCD